jgi:hypothetical protein
LGSQHQGVRKFPGCTDGKSETDWLQGDQEASPAPSLITSNFGWSCDQINQVLGEQVYKPATQASIIPAQYYKDPYQIDLYKRNNRFLTDINNENDVKNENYKANMLRLNSFIMYMFESDTIVIPRESSVSSLLV